MVNYYQLPVPGLLAEYTDMIDSRRDMAIFANYFKESVVFQAAFNNLYQFIIIVLLLIIISQQILSREKKPANGGGNESETDRKSVV